MISQNGISIFRFLSSECRKGSFTNYCEVILVCALGLSTLYNTVLHCWVKKKGKLNEKIRAKVEKQADSNLPVFSLCTTYSL